MFGETTGAVRVLLRLEGLCVMLAGFVAYSRFGLGWSTFALFFLAPDLSLLAYLAGPKYGAIAYNIAHSYVGAIACLALGFLLPDSGVLSAGLIWCAHIGFDRAFGFGLKYRDGFAFTHLGRIGRFSDSALTPAVNADRSR